MKTEMPKGVNHYSARFPTSKTLIIKYFYKINIALSIIVIILLL